LGFIAGPAPFFGKGKIPLPKKLRYDAYSINFEYAQTAQRGQSMGVLPPPKKKKKIAKIVCRLIKRKQNLPINEMWQLSVNFIGARLPGDIAVVKLIP